MRYCDDCVFIEYVKIEDSGEFVLLCGKTYVRCADERSAIFRDACGPKGRNYLSDKKEPAHDK